MMKLQVQVMSHRVDVLYNHEHEEEKISYKGMHNGAVWVFWTSVVHPVSGGDCYLSTVDNSLFNVFLSTTVLNVPWLQPVTDPAFLISLFILFVVCWESSISPDREELNTAFNKLEERLQSFAEHMEETQLPQEVALLYMVFQFNLLSM